MAKIDAQFDGYSKGSEAEQAYLEGRIYPALSSLDKKRHKCARAQVWLTASTAIIALVMPMLVLFPVTIPTVILHAIIAGLSTLISAAILAQHLLHLQAKATDYAHKVSTLQSLLHAYFLCADEFEGMEADAKLLRLHDRVERLLN